MAGIDKNNVFPNSMMVKAAKLGVSQFRSAEVTATGGTFEFGRVEPPASEPLPPPPPKE